MAVDENYKMIRDYVLRLVKTDVNFRKELLNELDADIKQMIIRYAHLDPEIENTIQKYMPVGGTGKII